MNDKQRAEFESKLGSAYWFDNGHDEIGDYYSSMETQIAYLGYQAALSSPSVMELVVALEKARNSMPKELAKQEGFYTRWAPNPAWVAINEALEPWEGK